jgi:DNA-binding beta-propeller fold protein YncE
VTARLCGIIVVLIAVVASLPPAVAVVAGAPASTPPRGSLVPLPGRAGCLMQIPRPAALIERCGPARAVGSAAQVAVSDDGRNVYVGGGHSIAVFRRNQLSGALTQLGGRAGCVERPPQCSVGALNGLSGLVVAPGGRHVYASSWWDAAFHGHLAAFARDGRTGALKALRCETCNPPRSSDYSGGLAISSDGNSVYTASPTITPALGAFRRDVKSGLLSEVAGPTGCVRRREVDRCAAAVALPFEPVRVAVSPDSRNVYVASGWSNGVDSTTVFAFARDRSTAGVTALPAPLGCVRPAAAAPCTRAIGLRGLAVEITVAPDGLNVYVLSFNREGDELMLTILERNPVTGGLSQSRDSGACLAGTPVSECSAVAALRGPSEHGFDLGGPGDVEVSPRGESVYLSRENERSFTALVAALRRDAEGRLVPLRSPYGCVSSPRQAGCTRAPALAHAAALAVSPDGRHLYAARLGWIAVFRRHR